MYYNVIKVPDLNMSELNEEMNLLYEAHKDNLVSVAIFSSQGKLISAVPISAEKKNRKVVEQDFFSTATSNLHLLGLIVLGIIIIITIFLYLMCRIFLMILPFVRTGLFL